MSAIARSMITVGKVLFPSRRMRVVVVALAALAASVSVAELAAAHIFASLIIPEGSLDRDRTVVLALAFFLLFVVVRVVHYGQVVLRMNVFERALAESETDPRLESWQWASAMELVGLLTLLTRGLVVAALIFWLSPTFGIVNLVGCLVILEVLGRALARQHSAQLGFRERQRARLPASNAERVRARVVSGEQGSLAAGAVVMVLLGVLVLLALDGAMPAAAAFVVFLAVRMESQIFNGLSPGLMRFARARVNSEPA